jgi:hypothetical protein
VTLISAAMANQDDLVTKDLPTLFDENERLVWRQQSINRLDATKRREFMLLFRQKVLCFAKQKLKK